MGIRIFASLMVFSAVVYTIYYIVKPYDTYFNSEEYSVMGYAAFIFITGVFLRIVRLFEERRILEHNTFYDVQWTQDLFSLVFENLPADTRTQSFERYLSNILMSKGIKGRVKEVILIQDYYEYTRLKSQVAELDEKLTEEGLNPKEKLLTKRNRGHLKQLLLDERERIINNELFRGKAIVVFQTIEAKLTIVKYFKYGFWKQLALKYFGCAYQGCFYKGNLLSTREAKEPQDMIFEQLYYPTINRVIRTVIAYLLSIIIIFFGLNTLGALQLWIRVAKDPETMFDRLKSTTFILRALVLSFFLGRSYRYANSLLIYGSHSAYDVGCLNYSIFSSFAIYVVVQCIIAFRNKQVWLNQLIQVLFIYLLQRVMLKAASIVSIWDSIQNGRMVIGTRLLSFTFQKLNEMYSKFDFMDGISTALPVLLVGFAYMAISPFILLPLIVVTLYIFAIVDKYRMIKWCAPMRLRSPDYILRAFKIYKWDCFCIFLGNIIGILEYALSIDQKEKFKHIVGYAIGAYMLGLFVAYVWWPESFHTEAKRKFYERNSKVHYTTVCKKFSSLYQDEDPLKEIIKEKEAESELAKE